MLNAASASDSSSSTSFVDIDLELQRESDAAAAAIATQPVILAFRDLKHDLLVPEGYYLMLEIAASSFAAQLENLEQENAPCSIPGLVAAFVEFLVNHPTTWEGRPANDRTQCIRLLLDVFECDFLAEDSPQTLASRLPGTDVQRQAMLRAINVAQEFTQRTHRTPSRLPALFSGSINLFAVFGGPGDAMAILEALRNLWHVHQDIVSALVETGVVMLKSCLLSASTSTRRGHIGGIDITSWLAHPETAPAAQQLQLPSVALPIAGLFQFVTFAIACHELNMSPKEVLGCVRGVAGYSTGIVAAAILATISDESGFRSGLSLVMQLLFEIGSAAEDLCHESSKVSSRSSDVTNTAMLQIIGCPLRDVERQITSLNLDLGTQQIVVAINNGPNNVIVSGPKQSIRALRQSLNKVRAAYDLDQSKTPANLRKPQIQLRDLPIPVPLHSPLLAEALTVASERLQDVSIKPSALQIPVFDSRSGVNLQATAEEDLVPCLLQMAMRDSNDWPLATRFEGATHVLDFGPGGFDGAGALLHENKNGTGVRVILASVEKGAPPVFGQRAEMLSKTLVANPDWYSTYAPTLQKEGNGQLSLDNKMVRLLGLPPIMVAGMTPTTASYELVSAIMNAGYHAELAAGGFHNSRDFSASIRRLVEKSPRGRGICINLIYGNPRQFRWQVPVIRNLRSEGVPIDGITFGAGVPSMDILKQFFDMNLRYLSFKPGSISAIDQVVEIAQSVPEYPIIMQWTGGRAGGHHSYEDFHQPMLECYARIRSCENIVLIAGSGFGGANDTYEYLSGEWSIPFQRTRMPFDGVLLGSRIMVAKEAKTSRAAKEAIVSTPGLDKDGAWWETYKAPAGGVVTVKSEMGEPIHKLATRGVLLWKELDETVFSIADESKRTAKLHGMKSTLIQRLNNDFQKVWFGCNSNGDAVDLEDMTYGEVLQRLVHLLYIHTERRWIDRSHMKLMADFVDRVDCHRSLPPDRPKTIYDLGDPIEAMTVILTKIGALEEQVLTHRDAQYFHMLCKRPGQKPPPFLTDMGSDFEVWFKKDSLWQSEDLDAVIDQDVGRICILQGPVAARHSTCIDEPVREILDGIHQIHIASVFRERYASSTAMISALHDDVNWVTSTVPSGCLVRREGNQSHFRLTESGNKEKWLRLIAGQPNTWLYAAVMSPDIWQDRKVIPNPVRRVLLASSHIHVVRIDGPQAKDLQLAIYEEEPPGERGLTRRSKHSLVFTYSGPDSIQVVFQTNENLAHVDGALTFTFSHHPETPLYPVWEEALSDRIHRMADFYRGLWFAGTSYASISKHHGFKVSTSTVREFIDSIHVDGYGGTSRSEKTSCSEILPDLAMVLAWSGLLEAVLQPDICGPMLDLVHLSNEFRLLQSVPTLEHGTIGDLHVEILAVLDEPIGRLVRAKAILSVANVPIVALIVEFLFRGYHEPLTSSFERTDEPQMELTLTTKAEVAVLKAKDWVTLNEANTNLIGARLVFILATTRHFASTTSGCYIQTTGDISDNNGYIVGHVYFKKYGITSNPVMEYLKRRGRAAIEGHALKAPPKLDTQRVKLPPSNVGYARASGDYNPIHTSHIFASYVGLPGTITHGMYISAVVRAKVELAAGCSSRVRMRSYKVSFVGMALPDTVLEVHVMHTEMYQGLRVLIFEAFDVDTNAKVVAGEAHVDQEPTAYLFTGQGSQKVGMGMDLLASCPVARAVWETADAYYVATYGFLITDIVRRNPKQLTVHFGGRRGQTIRDNYMAVKTDNGGQLEAVFPSIDDCTTSYTFRHEAGLLFSTEFSQPALMVMERAQFEHLQSKGLIVEDALFAGHSLGEYSALGHIGRVMPFQELLSLSFYRALIMNSAVPRDAHGRSQFGMMAVNPSRLSKHVDARMLDHMASLIASATQGSLQIVNYNIASQQYVASGSLLSLACLSAVADTLAARATDIRVVTGPEPGTTTIDGLAELVASKATQLASQSSRPVLKRGVGTTPLEGIDVPFHSSSLLPKMPAFRQMLHRHIPEGAVDAKRLVGRFVTNVTGGTFDISREGVQEAYDKTQSIVLRRVLEDMTGTRSVQMSV